MFKDLLNKIYEAELVLGNYPREEWDTWVSDVAAEFFEAGLMTDGEAEVAQQVSARYDIPMEHASVLLRDARAEAEYMNEPAYKDAESHGTAKRIKIPGLTDVEPAKSFLKADEAGFIVRNKQVSDARVVRNVVGALAGEIKSGRMKDFEYPNGSGATVGGKTGPVIKLITDNLSSLVVVKEY